MKNRAQLVSRFFVKAFLVEVCLSLSIPDRTHAARESRIDTITPHKLMIARYLTFAASRTASSGDSSHKHSLTHKDQIGDFSTQNRSCPVGRGAFSARSTEQRADPHCQMQKVCLLPGSSLYYGCGSLARLASLETCIVSPKAISCMAAVSCDDQPHQTYRVGAMATEDLHEERSR